MYKKLGIKTSIPFASWSSALAISVNISNLILRAKISNVHEIRKKWAQTTTYNTLLISCQQNIS